MGECTLGLSICWWGMSASARLRHREIPRIVRNLTWTTRPHPEVWDSRIFIARAMIVMLRLRP